MVDKTSKNYYKCPYELLKYRTVIFKKKKKKKKQFLDSKTYIFLNNDSDAIT